MGSTTKGRLRLCGDLESFYDLPYWTATTPGRASEARLPFFRGVVEGLPDGVDGLVATSDLQGVVKHQRGPKLLGVAVAEELTTLGRDGRIPSVERCVAVLAGDLYSAPSADVRGASGDVRQVWEAFAAVFGTTVGVAGNHDDINVDGMERAILLDDVAVDVCGLRVGGIGGIVGKPTKPRRRSEDDFVAAARRLHREVDLLVLHQPPQPDGPIRERGNTRLADALRSPVPSGWVVCGHAHWTDPVGAIGGTRVLNVDARVIVLVRP